MRSLGLLGVMLLGGCALLDALGEDDSGVSNPNPFPDGSVDADASSSSICRDAVFAGFLDRNGVLTGGSTCGSPAPDFDFSRCAFDDTFGHPGLVFEIDVLEPSDYVICLMSAEPYRAAIDSQVCDQPQGDCLEANDATNESCLQRFLDVGPLTIYWESLGEAGCHDMSLDIFSAMP